MCTFFATNAARVSLNLMMFFLRFCFYRPKAENRFLFWHRLWLLRDLNAGSHLAWQVTTAAAASADITTTVDSWRVRKFSSFGIMSSAAAASIREVQHTRWFMPTWKNCHKTVHFQENKHSNVAHQRFFFVQCMFNRSQKAKGCASTGYFVFVDVLGALNFNVTLRLCHRILQLKKLVGSARCRFKELQFENSRRWEIICLHSRLKLNWLTFSDSNSW